jgi:NADPH:quinone reductase-like Zn-dependent oxidoreductase
VVSLPGSLELTGAALLACPMGVALQAVETAAAVRAGETVVVTGAGGGLGVHAVQAAAALGARVLAVTSSPEKEARLPGYGAEEVIETGELDFSEIVAALTGDEGADAVIDTVGSTLFPSTLRSLGQYGRLVLLGEVAGGRVEINPAELIFRDIRILGASGVSRATVEKAAAMTASARLTPVVDQALPLEDADLAFELLGSRAVFGRVVLTC